MGSRHRLGLQLSPTHTVLPQFSRKLIVFSLYWLGAGIYKRALQPIGPAKNLKAPPSHIGCQTREVKVPSAAPYRTLEQVLVKRSTLSVLYKAPSHHNFVLGCYLFGGFCLTYAGLCYHTNVLHSPNDLAYWVIFAWSGISLFCSFVGIWFISKVSCI